jgi:hypothetical protein
MINFSAKYSFKLPLTICLIFNLLINSNSIFSQKDTVNISQLVWGPDYQIYLKLNNDSTYQYNFDELIIANPDEVFNRPTSFIFYPVAFDLHYIDSLLAIKSIRDYTAENAQKITRKVTLWNAVSEEIGGGWVHFVNCLLYSLETRTLTLDAPILKRPKSSWKPNPVTDSWKRTHKWEYYIPVEHKYAVKEYKQRKKQGQTLDIDNLPPSYIKAFLSTSDKKYKKLLKAHDYKTIAKIDLVKLLLGAPYLGDPQIDYIKSHVMQAISNYNAQKRPSILIFEKYEAAVAISMDGMGYKVQKIVFRDEENLSPEIIEQRTNIIKGLIELINISNNEAFKRKLTNVYQQDN